MTWGSQSRPQSEAPLIGPSVPGYAAWQQSLVGLVFRHDGTPPPANGRISDFHSGSTAKGPCVTLIRSQAVLQLAEGAFSVSSHALNLREFGQGSCAGRSVKAHFDDVMIYTDPVLCDVMMENALDNAQKHSHPNDRGITCRITVDGPPSPAPDAEACHRRTVRFVVSNRARPGTAIPKDIVPLVMNQRYQRPSGSLQSDGLGLRHCFAAATALGMRIRFDVEGELVTFCASLETEVYPGAQAVLRRRPTAPESPTIALFPANVRIYSIEDSPLMRRWLQSTLGGFAIAQTFGADAADVDEFLGAVLRDGDIAICDQNLEFGRETVHGTDLVCRLRDAGFAGLLCIFSANDAVEDAAEYAASGAHLSLGKGMRAQDLVSALKRAYVRHVAKEGGSAPERLHHVSSHLSLQSCASSPRDAAVLGPAAGLQHSPNEGAAGELLIIS